MPNTYPYLRVLGCWGSLDLWCGSCVASRETKLQSILAFKVPIGTVGANGFTLVTFMSILTR